MTFRSFQPPLRQTYVFDVHCDLHTRRLAAQLELLARDDCQPDGSGLLVVEQHRAIRLCFNYECSLVNGFHGTDCEEARILAFERQSKRAVRALVVIVNLLRRRKQVMKVRDDEWSAAGSSLSMLCHVKRTG